MCPDETDHYWVPIRLAARLLGVKVTAARVLAHRDRWRRTPTRPVGYLMADIRTTYDRRHHA